MGNFSTDWEPAVYQATANQQSKIAGQPAPPSSLSLKDLGSGRFDKTLERAREQGITIAEPVDEGELVRRIKEKQNPPITTETVLPRTSMRIKIARLLARFNTKKD